MGVNLSGVVVVGEVKPSKDIIHFYRDGNTLIFLDICINDVLSFSTICEAGLLYKADFTGDKHVEELMELLQDRTFIVFHYSEFADLTDREYAVVFKDGIYSKRTENVYSEILKLKMSFDFMFDHSFWSHEGAKKTYLAKKITDDGLHNG